MPQPRNPYTFLIIGTAIGAILGAVIGIAIGSAARSNTVTTVVSTHTLRVPGGLPATVTQASTLTSPTGGSSPTDTTTTDTTTTDTTFTDTTTTDTTSTDTTTDTSTATTTTDASGIEPNDVPPPDPYNPPRDFCKTHVCAPGFSKGYGYAVQCADGVWSQQGGQPRVCRNDGGLP